MNNVGNEVNGEVKVGDGDGISLDTVLADAIDGCDDDACSVLRVCADDVDKVRRGFLGLGKEETVKSFPCG